MMYPPCCDLHSESPISIERVISIFLNSGDCQNEVRKIPSKQPHPGMANQVSRCILCFPPDADRKQYKKGKKLVKEVRAARWRRRLLSTSIPWLSNGKEVNVEARGTTLRSSRYSRNNEPKISLQQLSPHPRLPNSSSESNSLGIPMIDTVQQHTTSGPVGPCTPMPIVHREHRGDKSMTVNSSQSQVNLSQMFDTTGWQSDTRHRARKSDRRLRRIP